MIIGISGNNGAGKDTFGALLEAAFHRLGKSAKRVAFADSLYTVCKILYGIPSKRECDAQPELKNSLCASGKTVRETLIAVGRALGEINPATFVNALKIGDHDFTIITDVRFKNEFNICDFRIAILREGYNDNVGTVQGHIINNFSLDSLEAEAERIANGLLG